MEAVAIITVILSCIALVAAIVWSAGKIRAGTIALAVEVKNLTDAVADIKGWLKSVDEKVDDVDRRLSHLEGRCDAPNCQKCGHPVSPKRGEST